MKFKRSIHSIFCPSPPLLHDRNRIKFPGEIRVSIPTFPFNRRVLTSSEAVSGLVTRFESFVYRCARLVRSGMGRGGEEELQSANTAGHRANVFLIRFPGD